MLVIQRVAFEAYCLGRVLNPMQNGGVSRFAKAVLVVLLSVWALLVLDLTAAEPPIWLIISLTALIFSIVGRMWRIEADYWLNKLNPITISVGDNDE